ncbi:hypothetical protein [Flavobacterium taihuense]|uniref:Uncharacterized protein n=1 Tax=Flavobacterium taihuense TaxID=2857508 RepID=A0ABS6Y019_9FLAO|nr:hypothetical protein [Flavobacterium taihuense]MBW4362264.1 hypothetical protein [Flavobacterium taihuense]
MKTTKELNDRILKITMVIRKEYPELSKYLLEMPETIPYIETPEMNKKVLKEYLNSLKEILDKYAPNHSIDI